MGTPSTPMQRVQKGSCLFPLVLGCILLCILDASPCQGAAANDNTRLRPRGSIHYQQQHHPQTKAVAPADGTWVGWIFGSPAKHKTWNEWLFGSAPAPAAPAPAPPKDPCALIHPLEREVLKEEERLTLLGMLGLTSAAAGKQVVDTQSIRLMLANILLEAFVPPNDPSLQPNMFNLFQGTLRSLRPPRLVWTWKDLQALAPARWTWTDIRNLSKTVVENSLGNSVIFMAYRPLLSSYVNDFIRGLIISIVVKAMEEYKADIKKYLEQIEGSGDNNTFSGSIGALNAGFPYWLEQEGWWETFSKKYKAALPKQTFFMARGYSWGRKNVSLPPLGLTGALPKNVILQAAPSSITMVALRQMVDFKQLGDLLTQTRVALRKSPIATVFALMDFLHENAKNIYTVRQTQIEAAFMDDVPNMLMPCFEVLFTGLYYGSAWLTDRYCANFTCSPPNATASALLEFFFVARQWAIFQMCAASVFNILTNYMPQERNLITPEGDLTSAFLKIFLANRIALTVDTLGMGLAVGSLMPNLSPGMTSALWWINWGSVAVSLISMKLRLSNIYNTFKYDIIVKYGTHMRKAASPDQDPASDIKTYTGVYKGLMRNNDIETASAIGAFFGTRFLVDPVKTLVCGAWEETKAIAYPEANKRKRTGWETVYDRFASKNVKLVGFALLNVVFWGILYNSWSSNTPATAPAT